VTFFITKHSNLSDVHVVFHLVIDKIDSALVLDNVLTSSSTTSHGLRNIVLTASRCDVSTLVLPAALVETGVESMAPEGLLHRRAETVLKTIKASLAATGEGGTLRIIHFVVPAVNSENTDQSLFTKFKTSLTTQGKKSIKNY